MLGYRGGLEAMEWASRQGWVKIWIESDSTSAVQAFGNRDVPWCMTSRWLQAMEDLSHVVITSTWREVNFAADCASLEVKVQGMAFIGVSMIIQVLIRILKLMPRGLDSMLFNIDLWCRVMFVVDVGGK
ncbi:hypothetical protein IFM89_023994 [Coptis chinensis]|uniref:RNase H type-1 domain-containing protein n=1 Tax=Coptis chinensis TaxID=261450 RepID=A0A835LN87_9MAGN|nr:hypothetical protein IFM89_023994 [Coptis chinensis]